MPSIIERLSTIPKLIFGTATTATGAVVSTAPSLPAQAAEMHPMQIAVWVATILAGLGTFGLAVVRGVLEIRREKNRKGNE
jgi:hypothetical protein